MSQEFFSNLFAKLRIPVIVCRYAAELPVAYMNVRAGLLFAPTYTTSALSGDTSLGRLPEILRFASGGEQDSFLLAVEKAGQVDRFDAELLTFDEKQLDFTLSGNRITLDGQDEYFVLYLVEAGTEGEHHTADANLNFLATIIRTSFLEEDADKAINKVLSMAGEFVRVDRCYVFEEISTVLTRNTYEWCAPGVEPAIANLQNLDKEDYNYDAIIKGGMYITDDVRDLPGEDRAILEAQGIRSIAIIPFFQKEQPLGYVGFDDCTRYRTWSHDEIDFLLNISQILAILISRRKTEQESHRSGEVLELLFDNSEDIIYVSRLSDYSLIFVNQALTTQLGKPKEELLGKPCWSVLQAGQDGPCSFCPIPHLSIKPGQDRSDVYVWEQTNTITGKTSIAKDNIVKWVDGEYVHVETATDISERTEYEEQLRRFASIDSMTGVYNRVWGTMLLEGEYAKNKPGMSLCFLDVDGLKKVNDTYGHAAGDELLTQIVNIINQHLDPGEFVCRWGGDEFLLLLDTPPEQSAERIRDIQDHMARFNKTSGKPFELSFSFGIVPFSPAQSESFDAMITNADAEMYDNKMNKRGLKRRKDD